MSEPTTPTPTKPRVEIPAGWVAFCHEGKKRTLGIRQFTHASVAFSDAVIVTRPTVEALLAELARLGYSVPRPNGV